MKKNLIKLTALLILSPLTLVGVEFRDASFEPVEGYSEMIYEVGGEEKRVFVASETLLDSSAIEKAYVAPSGTSHYLGKTETIYGVTIIFTDEGSEKMQRITESRISKPLAILVDGEVLSVPVVRAKITQTAGIGSFGSEAEADMMLLRIIQSFDLEKQNSAQVQAMKASLAKNRGDLKAALEFLQNATTTEPNVADFWAELGMVQAARSEKEEAMDSYSRALSLLRKESEQRLIEQVMILLLMERDNDAKDLFSLHASEIKETHPGLSFDDLLEMKIH